MKRGKVYLTEFYVKLRDTYHRLSFLVKLVNFDFRLKYRGKTSAANLFLSAITKPFPCGSQWIISWLASSSSISINCDSRKKNVRHGDH